MESGKADDSQDFYSQASAVLGEDFWQEIGDLLPNPGPRIDMYSTSSAIVVLAELPGLASTDQVRIRLRGQTLELEGELPCPYPVTRSRIALSERFFGDFSRSLQLPNPVSAAGIAAKYESGLLVVTLPVGEAPQATAIPIDNAGGQGGTPVPDAQPQTKQPPSETASE